MNKNVRLVSLIVSFLLSIAGIVLTVKGLFQ